MDHATLKRQLLNHYLSQQAGQPLPSVPSSNAAPTQPQSQSQPQRNGRSANALAANARAETRANAVQAQANSSSAPTPAPTATTSARASSTHVPTTSSHSNNNNNNNMAIVTAADLPTPAQLADFKKYVKAWIQVDDNIKQLRRAVKERNVLKKQITTKVTEFMRRYNIEDLNTSDGLLRYRVQTIKAPLRQAEVRQKLLECHTEGLTAEQLTQQLMDARGTVEKHSLRRFRPPRGVDAPSIMSSNDSSSASE